MIAFLRCSGVSDSKKLEAGILFGLENPQPLFIVAEVAAHFSRIGAKERGRCGGYVPAVDDEIQRQMVPFDAPSPAARAIGRTENCEIIALGVANRRVRARLSPARAGSPPGP